MKRSALFVFIQFIIASLVQSKVIQEDIYFHRFTKDRWKYIGKFSYQNSAGGFNLQARFHKSITHIMTLPVIKLQFLGYHEDDWNKAMKTENCQERVGFAKIARDFTLPLDGTYNTPPVSGEVAEKVGTGFWYFAIADCEKTFPTLSDIGNKIKVDLALTNADQSHFSEQENGLLWPHFLMALAYLAFFYTNIQKLMRYYQKEEEIDYPFLVLNIACFVEFLSLIMEWLHLLIVSYNGIGHTIPNFLSSGLTVFAQFTISCLLILLATGWGIEYEEIPELDLYLPLGIMVAMMHFIIVGLGRLTEEDPFRYHDFDSWAGIVLSVIKIILAAVFLYFVAQTYVRAHKKLRHFITQLGVLGSLYILAMPLALLVVGTFIPSYLQHYAIVLGNMVVQGTTMLVLAFILSSSRSSYYSISVKSKSMLPSNKLE